MDISTCTCDYCARVGDDVPDADPINPPIVESLEDLERYIAPPSKAKREPRKDVVYVLVRRYGRGDTQMLGVFATHAKAKAAETVYRMKYRKAPQIVTEITRAEIDGVRF